MDLILKRIVPLLALSLLILAALPVMGQMIARPVRVTIRHRSID